jgi:hypothetical protein
MLCSMSHMSYFDYLQRNLNGSDDNIHTVEQNDIKQFEVQL